MIAFGARAAGVRADPGFLRIGRGERGISDHVKPLVLQGNAQVYVTLHAVDGIFTSLRVEVPG